MDALTEFVLLVTLVVGVPLFAIRAFCNAITRHIESWAPARTSRYQLVRIIPQPRDRNLSR